MSQAQSVLLRYREHPAPIRWALQGVRFALRTFYRIRPAKEDFPWLVRSAVAEIERRLSKQARIFEWGSGASTLYFAQRAAGVVSIEHDRDWHKRVKERLRLLGAPHVELRLSVPQSARSSFERPTEWSVVGYSLRKAQFESYVDEILGFPESSFDFILVDGRARVGCVLNAISRLKSGGTLVLDNTERAEYEPVFGWLAAWNPKRFSDGLSETSLFKKP